ncbi:hypothetical protein ES708_34103 [subsurface metagenome]
MIDYPLSTFKLDPKSFSPPEGGRINPIPGTIYRVLIPVPAGM